MLVVAPINVMYNVWPLQKNDWEEFKDLKVVVLHGKDKEERLKEEADIYVINPEGLEWLFQPTYDIKVDSKGKQVVNKKKILHVNRARLSRCDALLVDESTKFKDYSTNRFSLLRSIIPSFKRRYILTGTIVPNGLEDLFGQIYILDEGASLGQYITHYRKKFFHQAGYGGYSWAPNEGAAEKISTKIAPLVIQVDHTDYLKMPKLLPPNDIFITIPPEVMKIYKQMEDKLKAEVAAGTVVAANAAVASSKCRQICQGALYTDAYRSYDVLHTAKLDALEDFLEQMRGNPILIPYVFQFDKELIIKRMDLPAIGDKPAENARLIRAFRDGKLPALLGHPESISLGIDGLQDSCSNIFWYGVPWNLLHYIQTIDRVWRQGNQAETVQIHRLLAKDTIDENVVEVVEDKEATESSFLKLLGGKT